MDRVVIDSVTMLNLVKYCQDGNSMLDVQTAAVQAMKNEEVAQTPFVVKGSIAGVLSNEVTGETNLIINGSKILTLDPSKKPVPMPTQAGIAYNEVGFFICCPLGLAFSRANL